MQTDGIVSGKRALEVLKETNADGVMIARGSLGKPYRIKEIVETVKENKQIDEEKISLDELINMVVKHYDILKSFVGEEKASREIRKHVIWYMAGIPNGKNVRMRVQEITSKEALLNLLNEIKK